MCGSKIKRFAAFCYNHLQEMRFSSNVIDRNTTIESLENENNVTFIRKFGLFSNNGPLPQDIINIINNNKALLEILSYFDSDFISLYLSIYTLFSQYELAKDINHLVDNNKHLPVLLQEYEYITVNEILNYIKSTSKIKNVIISDLNMFIKKTNISFILGKHCLNSKIPIGKYFICLNLLKIYFTVTYDEYYNLLSFNILKKIQDSILYYTAYKIEMAFIIHIETKALYKTKHYHFILGSTQLGLNSWIYIPEVENIDDAYINLKTFPNYGKTF